MFADVKAKNWGQAYSFVANTNNTDLNSFIADLNGANGDLRTFSSLANVKTRVLHATDNDALVHTDLQWSTAVGAIYDSLDLQVVNKDGSLESHMAGREASLMFLHRSFPSISCAGTS